VEGLFSVERVTFANPESGYAVVQLVPTDAKAPGTVTATGIFGAVQEGTSYRLQGTWHHDPRYGPQIRASSAIVETPTTPAAIERYLAGASIKGLGPHHARLIVEHFGADVIEELDRGGERLQEVRGIGPIRAGKILTSWEEHRSINRLMVNLQGVAGLSPRQAQRLYREYGNDAWRAVSTDPYLLAERVPGFGFRTCDRIGRSLGVAPDAPGRLQAGILHVLSQALSDGHLWTAPDQLLAEAAQLLDTQPQVLEPHLATLVADARAVRRTIGGAHGAEGIYLPAVAEAEARIASRLRVWLAHQPSDALQLGTEQAGALIRQTSRGALTDEQKQAVSALLTGTRMLVLTGGPGTGKTTTMRALILCLEALPVSYALCATTGRAAKQLALATDRQAATVHRHLGLGPQGDQSRSEPIQEVVLIIDEASMIDLWLMDQIVARLGEGTHLFLVGDVDQLPPVGPGAVLHDLIDVSSRMPASQVGVVRLEQIFRQEAGEASLIVGNSHRIRRGERPVRPSGADSDYYEMPRETPAEALTLAVELVAERLPAYLGVPPDEVQVLTPVHGGEAGVQALNAALQARLNPPSPKRAECLLGRREQGAPVVLRVGDKVRQTRNDYQKRVFNGDLGTVQQIDSDDQVVRVRFDEAFVDYAFAELDDLVHSWAMTVHAAQGSQWPAVVVIMLASHYVMLERNILYTALSRAQRMAVLISQERALRIALQRTTLVGRRTDLAARLLP
jgi:exodeoxyribonuclease V alpha subunit